MHHDYKKEAGIQYLKHFRILFIIIGVLLTIFLAEIAIVNMKNNRPRGNTSAPQERVYDYANVLTNEEEERLRSQIAGAEKRIRMDIVIVTIDQSVEGWDAAELYGYNSPYWEVNMEAIADDFWDDNGYGYNKSFEGDGVLLLHNWYPGQNGEHLSTSGKAEWELSDYELDRILNRVDRYYETNPYRAYSEFIDVLESELRQRGSAPLPWPLVILVPIIVTFGYSRTNMSQYKQKDTTAVNAYVLGGKPIMKNQKDEFIRKSVTSRRIETSSGGGYSGGHSRSSGGGGHHHSSSGASHGGRSHRH